jgi:hypothetical protein
MLFSKICFCALEEMRICSLLAVWALNRLSLRSIADFELIFLHSLCRHCVYNGNYHSSDVADPIRSYLLDMCFRFNKKQDTKNKHKDGLIKALNSFHCNLYHQMLQALVDFICQSGPQNDTLLLFAEWIGGLENCSEKLYFVQLLVTQAFPLETNHVRIIGFLLGLCKACPEIGITLLLDSNFAETCFQSNVSQIRKLILNISKMILPSFNSHSQKIPDFFFSIVYRYLQGGEMDCSNNNNKLQALYLLSSLLDTQVQPNTLVKVSGWMVEFFSASDLVHFLKPATEVVRTFITAVRESPCHHQSEKAPLNANLRLSLIPSLLKALIQMNSQGVQKAQTSDSTKQRTADIIDCMRDALFFVKTTDLISCIAVQNLSIQKEFCELVISKFVVDHNSTAPGEGPAEIDVVGFMTFLVQTSSSGWIRSEALEITVSHTQIILSVERLIQHLHATKTSAFYTLLSSLWKGLVEDCGMMIHILDILNISYTAANQKIDPGCDIDFHIIQPLNEVVSRAVKGN